MEEYETVERARNCVEKLTPLKMDCGRYCGCACCANDESGENGMCLLPGEEKFYAASRPDFPFHLLQDDTLIDGGLRLVCEGFCDRANRPFACRIFPLRLRVTENGCKPEIDPRAWAVCPLPERGGIIGLDHAFVKAVKQAGEILIDNPTIRAALLKEQNALDAQRYL